LVERLLEIVGRIVKLLVERAQFFCYALRHVGEGRLAGRNIHPGNVASSRHGLVHEICVVIAADAR
jgi:hypothetical protein